MVRDDFNDITNNPPHYSRTMGDTGSDIYGGAITASRYIETRALKLYQSLASIEKEMKKQPNGRWFYITRTNRNKPLVVMPYDEFLYLLRKEYGK